MGKYFGPEFDRLYESWTPQQRRKFWVGLAVACIIAFGLVCVLR